MPVDADSLPASFLSEALAGWSFQLPVLKHIEDEDSLFDHHDFDLPSLKLPYRHKDRQDAPSAFELPDLAAFAHNALPLPDEFTDASVSSLEDLPDPLSRGQEAEAASSALGDDIWSSREALPPLKGETRLLSWASLVYNPHGHPPYTNAPQPGFLSEAGASAFDAAIQEQAQASTSQIKAGSVIRSDAHLDSLFALGLGRSSLLFPVDSSGKTFGKAIEDSKLSGTTTELSASVIDDFRDLGNTTLRLREFVESTYKSNNICAGVVALASATRVILDAIEEYCVGRQKDTASLIQLQHLFERPRELLALVQDLQDRLPNDVLETGDSDVANAAFETWIDHEDRGAHIETPRAFFLRLATPWRETLELLIGSRSHFAPVNSSVLHSEAEPGTGTSLNEHPQALKLPEFLSATNTALIAELEECTAYLEEHGHRDLMSPWGNLEGHQNSVRWLLSWNDLERNFSNDAEAATAVAGSITDPRMDDTGQVNDEVHLISGSDLDLPPAKCWLMDVSALNDPISLVDPETSVNGATVDELELSVRAFLRSESFEQQLSDSLPARLMLQHSIDPLLRAQHALLTTRTLHSILHVHHLQQHLHSLYTFHVFGPGDFAAELSHVLFATDVQTSERRKGIARMGDVGNMSLGLGSGQRREWPPTSSELSLALMGVLDACGATNGRASQDLARQAFSMPTSNEEHQSQSQTRFSFALRDELDPEAIDKILDADSICALDFLKLAYTPPPALRIIFTDTVLEKYDRCFKLLLRLLRVQYVVGQLYKDLCSGRSSKTSIRAPSSDREQIEAHALRLQATSLMTTLLSYIRHTGIEAPWADLMSYITELETSVASPPQTTPQHSAPQQRPGQYTLHTLQITHTRTLNRILSSLFLRPRQQKIATALEDLLQDVLDFAKAIRVGTQRGAEASDEGTDLRTLRQRFDDHVKIFVRTLEEAAERAEMGKGGRGHRHVERDWEEAEEERKIGQGFAGLAELLRSGGD